MERNQFYYTRKELVQPKASDAAAAEPKYEEFIDSFSIHQILRSRGLENGQRMVLLADIHERWTSTPILGKSGKIASYKREKDSFQSEIYLDKIDSERFIKLLSIE